MNKGKKAWWTLGVILTTIALFLGLCILCCRGTKFRLYHNFPKPKKDEGELVLQGFKEPSVHVLANYAGQGFPA